MVKYLVIGMIIVLTVRVIPYMGAPFSYSLLTEMTFFNILSFDVYYFLSVLNTRMLPSLQADILRVLPLINFSTGHMVVSLLVGWS